MLIGDTSSPPGNEKNMKYACPQCGTAYELGPEHYNPKLECQCGAKFTVSPPDQAAVAPEPKKNSSRQPGTPAAVQIVAAVSVLFMVIGGAAILIGLLCFLDSQNPLHLATVAGGLLLLIQGGFIGCLSIMADKLHRIEWYISEFYKNK